MAAMPVAAVSSARIFYIPQTQAPRLTRQSQTAPGLRSGWRLRQLRQRVSAQVAFLRQDIGYVGIAAGDLDQPRHFGDAVHVRFLDFALHHVGIGRRRIGRDACRRHESGGAVFLQNLRIGEAGKLQRAALRIYGAVAFLHGDDAAEADIDVVVGALERDRAALAKHRVAVTGHELAGAVDLKRAVAGVALAARGLHHEIGFAVDGDVERAAGAVNGARRHVDIAGAVIDEVDLAVAAVEILIAGVRLQILAEHVFVGLEPGRVDIGDIVGDRIELVPEHHLPRQADEKGILHRKDSPLCAESAAVRHRLLRPARPPKLSSVWLIAEAVPRAGWRVKPSSINMLVLTDKSPESAEKVW